MVFASLELRMYRLLRGMRGFAGLERLGHFEV
jgi:hypothetical protein